QKDGKEKKPASNIGLLVGIAVGGGVLVLGVIIVLAFARKKPPAAAMRPGAGQGPAYPMPGQPMPGQPMPGQPMPGQPYPMPGQAPMYGRAPAAAQPSTPVAKTMAIQSGASASGGIAPTAFGSMAIGSLQCTRGRLIGQ